MSDDEDGGVPVAKMAAPADSLQNRFRLAVERTRASKDISGKLSTTTLIVHVCVTDKHATPLAANQIPSPPSTDSPSRPFLRAYTAAAARETSTKDKLLLYA